MILPQFFLVVVFLVHYVSGNPMPRPQGCGSSSMTCCLRRGAPNRRCEDALSTSYTSHSDYFQPNDVFGPTVRPFQVPVTLETSSGAESIALIIFSVNIQVGQFTMDCLFDLYGPQTAIRDLQARDSRVQGIRVRYAFFSAPSPLRPQQTWFIIGPVFGGTTTRTEFVYREIQIYLNREVRDHALAYYLSAETHRRGADYRIYYRVDPIDEHGQVITGEPPPHHPP
ncbi:hypothetical protein BKA81DRAFT_351516 [Phyllosticta paracitricarpa]|uniref:Uncharacterized protein n=1 Tax=Phyllosticta paracitricarpa TaxID=2016321 RepID=A0ABR1N6K6_9PEZI